MVMAKVCNTTEPEKDFKEFRQALFKKFTLPPRIIHLRKLSQENHVKRIQMALAKRQLQHSDEGKFGFLIMGSKKKYANAKSKIMQNEKSLTDSETINKNMMPKPKGSTSEINLNSKKIKIVYRTPKHLKTSEAGDMTQKGNTSVCPEKSLNSVKKQVTEADKDHYFTMQKLRSCIPKSSKGKRYRKKNYKCDDKRDKFDKSLPESSRNTATKEINSRPKYNNAKVESKQGGNKPSKIPIFTSRVRSNEDKINNNMTPVSTAKKIAKMNSISRSKENTSGISGGKAQDKRQSTSFSTKLEGKDFSETVKPPGRHMQQQFGISNIKCKESPNHSPQSDVTVWLDSVDVSKTSVSSQLNHLVAEADEYLRRQQEADTTHKLEKRMEDNLEPVKSNRHVTHYWNIAEHFPVDEREVDFVEGGLSPEGQYEDCYEYIFGQHDDAVDIKDELNKNVSYICESEVSSEDEESIKDKVSDSYEKSEVHRSVIDSRKVQEISKSPISSKFTFKHYNMPFARFQKQDQGKTNSLNVPEKEPSVKNPDSDNFRTTALVTPGRKKVDTKIEATVNSKVNRKKIRTPK